MAIRFGKSAKFILLVVSIAMIAGGLYLLAAELLWARIIYDWMLMAGAMLAALGTYLLWEDFLAPAFGIRGDE